MEAPVIIIGKKEFRKWVVEHILAIEASLKDSQLTQEKVDTLTTQVLENRARMKETQNG